MSKRKLETAQEDGLTHKTTKKGEIEMLDLYLDTVNRKVLDFDFEKICSVTLSNLNVYCCLVCGQYYQGRGKNTKAYIHSIDEDHKVFINLKTLKVYILPENYEIFDTSLNDIKAIIEPKYSEEQVAAIDTVELRGVDLNNKRFTPGYIGLNNIKNSDYINVIIQALVHIPEIRNLMLLLPNTNQDEWSTCYSELIKQFSLLTRKMWHTFNFKSHVSPHEFVQEVITRSNGSFRGEYQCDAAEFLTWFLNTLNFDFKQASKLKEKMKTSTEDKNVKKEKRSNPIIGNFQGLIRVITQDLKLTKLRERQEDPIEIDFDNKVERKENKFLILGLELPPPPLFRDEGEIVIPQIPLVTLLKKYNGSCSVELKGHAKQYDILSLPKYIIIHIKRFEKNNFMLEKNPTIVNFPTQNVAFGDLISEKDNKYQSKKAKSRLYDLFVNIAYESKSSSHEQQDNNNNAFSNLKKQSAITNAINVQKATKLPPVAFQSSGERSSFGSTTTELYGNNQILGAPVGTKNVDLKAKNESGVTVLPLGGQYVMHVRDPSTNQWYRICDLDVQPIIPQLIPLSESYLQIWKLK